MSSLTPPPGLATTRAAFVLDTIDGPEIYLSARDLAKAVIDGMGFVIVTKTFEATARILTDNAAPSIELTDLFATACMDHARERSATSGYAARRVVRERHIDALVEKISERRVQAQIAAVIGVKP